MVPYSFAMPSSVNGDRFAELRRLYNAGPTLRLVLI